MSNVLNEDEMETPHRIKNINAKYSDTFSPTFSISLPFKRKYSKVQRNEILLNSSPNLSNCNMPLVSMAKIWWPKNSQTFAANKIIIPAIAQYFGVEDFLNKIPPNIITIPQSADIIIAFII